jgi:hypothetical protein
MKKTHICRCRTVRIGTGIGKKKKQGIELRRTEQGKKIFRGM